MRVYKYNFNHYNISNNFCRNFCVIKILIFKTNFMLQRKMKQIVMLLLLVFSLSTLSQERDSESGWISLGMRSTASLFDSDGSGLGSGGQFRVQLSKKVNTDWFADYISINVKDKIRSDYYHIGWSVLFYPLEKKEEKTKFLQPYIMAGHCFDYNSKTAIMNPSNSEKRWGSAVQAGIGTHFNVTNRFDISLNCQYMIHLTKEIETEIVGDEISFSKNKGSALEGHLLATVSVNYKLFKIWKK